MPSSDEPGSDVRRIKTFSSALIAAEELAWTSVTAEHQNETSLDTIAMANNIAYYADGLDVYYGYMWKWEDGGGDLIERIYSAAETEDETLSQKANDETERSEPYSPPRKVWPFLKYITSHDNSYAMPHNNVANPSISFYQGLLGRLKMLSQGFSDDSEPISIFGLRCEALTCHQKLYDLNKR